MKWSRYHDRFNIGKHIKYHHYDQRTIKKRSCHQKLIEHSIQETRVRGREVNVLQVVGEKEIHFDICFLFKNLQQNNENSPDRGAHMQ